MCTDTRMDIYVRQEDRQKIADKAKKLGLSFSKLLVTGALEYDEGHEKTRGD